MFFVLDTDVVSNLRKQHPIPQLLNWLSQTPEEQIGIPLSVIFEIQNGIEGLRVNGKIDKADEIEVWLDELLQARGECIISPGVEVARLQARMFSTPALRNFLWPDPRSTKLKFGVDLSVASTAIVHDGVVVTFNTLDYLEIHQHFPLPGLYNPGRDEWVIAGEDDGVPPPP